MTKATYHKDGVSYTVSHEKGEREVLGEDFSLDHWNFDNSKATLDTKDGRWELWPRVRDADRVGKEQEHPTGPIILPDGSVFIHDDLPEGNKYYSELGEKPESVRKYVDNKNKQSS